MNSEYIIKIKGDTSNLEKMINKAQGSLKRLENDEVLIKLNYDGNVKNFNKEFDKILKSCPELSIQFQYNVNNKLLNKELDKLKDLENIKLDIETKNVEEKITSLISGLNESVDKNDLENVIESKIKYIYKYINTIQDLGGKIDFNFEDELYKVVEDTDYEKILDEFIDNFDISKLKLFNIKKPLDDEINDTKKRIKDFQDYLKALEEKGAVKAGIGTEFDQLQDEIKILRSDIDDIHEALNNVTGEAFQDLTNQVKDLNEQLIFTLDKLEKVTGVSLGRDSLKNVIGQWYTDDITKTNERYTAFNSSTLKTAGANAAAAADGVSEELIRSAIEAMGDEADGIIHSYPENFAAFSDTDIITAFKLFEEGISKQLVTSFNEIMSLDMSNINKDNKEQIISDIQKAFDNFENNDLYEISIGQFKETLLKAADSIVNNKNNKISTDVIESFKNKYSEFVTQMNENISVGEYFDGLENILADIKNTLKGQNTSADTIKTQYLQLLNITSELSGTVNNYLKDQLQLGFQNILKDILNNPINLINKNIPALKVEGLSDFLNTDSIVKASIEATDTAKNAIKKAQDSASPSEEARKLGNDFGEGYALGIKDKLPDAEQAALNLSKVALSALNRDDNNFWMAGVEHSRQYEKGVQEGLSSLDSEAVDINNSINKVTISDIDIEKIQEVINKIINKLDEVIEKIQLISDNASTAFTDKSGIELWKNEIITAIKEIGHIAENEISNDLAKALSNWRIGDALRNAQGERRGKKNILNERSLGFYGNNKIYGEYDYDLPHGVRTETLRDYAAKQGIRLKGMVHSHPPNYSAMFSTPYIDKEGKQHYADLWSWFDAVEDKRHDIETEIIKAIPSGETLVFNIKKFYENFSNYFDKDARKHYTKLFNEGFSRIDDKKNNNWKDYIDAFNKQYGKNYSADKITNNELTNLKSYIQQQEMIKFLSQLKDKNGKKFNWDDYGEILTEEQFNEKYGNFNANDQELSEIVKLLSEILVKISSLDLSKLDNLTNIIEQLQNIINKLNGNEAKPIAKTKSKASTEEIKLPNVTDVANSSAEALNKEAQSVQKITDAFKELNPLKESNIDLNKQLKITAEESAEALSKEASTAKETSQNIDNLNNKEKTEEETKGSQNAKPKTLKDFYEKFGTPTQSLDGNYFANYAELIAELGGRFKELNVEAEDFSEQKLNTIFFEELIKDINLSEDELMVIKGLLEDINTLLPGGKFAHLTDDKANFSYIDKQLSKINEIVLGNYNINNQDIKNATDILSYANNSIEVTVRPKVDTDIFLQEVNNELNGSNVYINVLPEIYSPTNFADSVTERLTEPAFIDIRPLVNAESIQREIESEFRDKPIKIPIEIDNNKSNLSLDKVNQELRETGNTAETESTTLLSLLDPLDKIRQSIIEKNNLLTQEGEIVKTSVSSEVEWFNKLNEKINEIIITIGSKISMIRTERAEVEAAVQSELIALEQLLNHPPVDIKLNIDDLRLIDDIQNVLSKIDFNYKIKPIYSGPVIDTNYFDSNNEINNLSSLLDPLEKIKTAITEKNNLFLSEEEVVKNTVWGEINNLSLLLSCIEEIIQAIKNLNSQFSNLSFDSLTQLMKQFKSNKTNNTNIEGIVENLSKLAKGLSELKIDDNGFIDSVNRIINASKQLKDVVKDAETVNKANKKTGNKSKKEKDPAIKLYKDRANLESKRLNLIDKRDNGNGLTIKEAGELAGIEVQLKQIDDQIQNIDQSTDAAKQALQDYNNTINITTAEIKGANEERKKVADEKVAKNTADELQSQIEKYNKLQTKAKEVFENSDKYVESFRNSLKTISEENIDLTNIDEIKNKIKELENSLDDKTLKANLEGTYTKLLSFYEKIQKQLATEPHMTSNVKMQYRALADEIDNLVKSGNVLPGTLNRITKAFINLNAQDAKTKGFLRSVADRTREMNVKFLGQFFSFYDIIRYGREIFGVIEELDTSLVDLRKTTAMSASELEDYYFESNKIAKQMGVTTNEIISQSAAWSRLGFNTAEATKEMTQLSSKFASISPGMTTDEAQSGIVSIVKAWDIATDDVEREVLDNINILGNRFAETNLDIVEGMQRSAAALSAVGEDYHSAFALFTGGKILYLSVQKCA